MTDQTTPEPTPARTELYRAARAQELLDNPLMAEALAAWEQEITLQWQNSPLRDNEGREHLRRLLQASREFKLYLSSVAQTGALVRLDLERKGVVQKLRDRLPW
jgi:hypothetical protein